MGWMSYPYSILTLGACVLGDQATFFGGGGIGGQTPLPGEDRVRYSGETGCPCELPE